MSMLKEYGFTVARQNFSNVFDDVQKYVPSLIKARKQTEEDGILLHRQIFEYVLQAYTFQTTIRQEEDASYSAWINPINDYAIGDTEEECKQQAVQAAKEFATDLIEFPEMFRTNRRPLIPYALRILLCESDEQILFVLFGESLAQV